MLAKEDKFALFICVLLRDIGENVAQLIDENNAPGSGPSQKQMFDGIAGRKISGTASHFAIQMLWFASLMHYRIANIAMQFS